MLIKEQLLLLFGFCEKPEVLVININYVTSPLRKMLKAFITKSQLIQFLMHLNIN